MDERQKRQTVIENEIKNNKESFKEGKTSTYTKQVGDKIKTIEKTEYSNGTVKEKIIKLQKGSKVIFG